MLHKLFLLSAFSLCSVVVFPQKKSMPPRVVPSRPAVHPVGKPSVALISPERRVRFAQREEARQSLVILRNESHLLPLNRLDTLKMMVVTIGSGKINPMPQMIGRYIRSDYLTMPYGSKIENISASIPKSSFYNLLVVVVAEPDGVAVTTTIGQSPGQLIAEKFVGIKTVLLLFGSSGFLEQWTGNSPSPAIIVSEKADYDRFDLSAQMLFGAIPSVGKLRFDLSQFRKGEGISLPPTRRLSYVLPEELGLDSVRFSQKMDSLVAIGLREKAFPGCQLVLAKKGCIFYRKAFGFHTYDHSQPVQNDDLYDLASVTKILAPVPALMMLADQKKFSVTGKMSTYWTDWKGSNKEGILVADLLSHQARLRSGVFLWPATIDENRRYKSEYYAMQPKPGYDLRVSGNLWMINSYSDTVYKAIRESRLLKTKKYEYSDLGFVLLPRVIEHLSGVAYETFLKEKLYARLGAWSLMYKPYLTVPGEKIVPTEDDQLFRHELLHGFVHDETAALMGGVSGNAGLFGSAGDVAKVMQLYLQDGEYGNERLIAAGTVKNWTSSHFQKTNNRRGFGFDKPAFVVNRYTGRERYPSKVVSEQSYGHSGYTGTFVWADPANDLLFVFLSNRVFPDRDNHKINKLRLRALLLENFFQLAGAKPLPR